MMALLAIITCTLGFTGLALAINRHHQQVAGRAPGPVARWWLRGVGITGLVVSFTICIDMSGWGTGMVAWFGMATVAALAVALVLSYRPSLLRVFLPPGSPPAAHSTR